MNQPVCPTLFGGFTLNGMKLALPLACLREAVPRQTLSELPSASHGIVGGLPYHATLLPVLDLCRLLDKSRHSDAAASILVIVVDGYLFGLLADTVNGIFTSKPDSAQPTQSSDLLAGVFAGTLVRQDDDSVVSLLALDKLAQADHFTMIADPRLEHRDDGEQHATAGRTVATDAAVMQSVMVVQCGGHDLAIDALSVHTTISSFNIEKSPLAVGHCLGVIQYMGSAIPILDFHAFCGFGPHPDRLDSAATANKPPAGSGLLKHRPKTAFMVANQHGKLAFLIDQIVDMVRFDRSQLHALPDCALQRPQLFAGAIERAGLPDQLLARLNPASECLLLDSDALLASPEVISFTATNAPGGTPSHSSVSCQSAGGRAAEADQGGNAMLLYRAGLEFATEVSQIKAILPYPDNIHQPDKDDIFVGLMQHRHQTVPLLDLCRLQTGKRFEAGNSSCVLIVESGQQTLGFLVESLSTIASSPWQPEISSLGGKPTAAQDSQEKNRLALFHIDGREKMLTVLNLAGLNQRLRAPAALAGPL